MNSFDTKVAGYTALGILGLGGYTYLSTPSSLSTLLKNNLKHLLVDSDSPLKNETLFEEYEHFASEKYERFANRMTHSFMKTALYVGGVGTAVVVGRIAVELLGTYFQVSLARYISKPKLAMEYHFETLSSRLYQIASSPYRLVCNFLFPKPPFSETTPIFNPEIQEETRLLFNSVRNIVENKGIMTHLLLFGEPGVGKTMFAEQLAKNANCNYILTSGSIFSPFIKRGEHTAALNDLFDRIEKGSKPTVLVIDEAESLLQSRDRADIEHVELLDTFLYLTGKPSQKLMLVLLTNRPQDLDEAIISRMDHRLFIPPPEKKERLKILNLYLEKFQIHSNPFTPEYLNSMNEKIQGFTGRDIFKLCNAFSIAKTSHQQNLLTKKMVEETLSRILKNRLLMKEQILKDSKR